MLTLLLISVSSLTWSAANTSTPQKTLSTAIREEPYTLDPALAFDSLSLRVVGSIYETLFQTAYLDAPNRPHPLLAADTPKMGDDELTAVIRLRRDARYPDGRAVQAPDFVRAILRLAQPDLKSPGLALLGKRLRGLENFAEQLKTAKDSATSVKLFNKGIEGIVALDDFTLKFVFNRKFPQFEEIFSMPFTAPIPAGTTDLANHPIGSGPFQLVGWQKGHVLVLERNPRFHPDFYPVTPVTQNAGRKLPMIERIEFNVIADEDEALKQYHLGKLDLLPVAETFKALGIGEKIRKELNTFYYIAINHRDPLLGENRALRQALSSAVDRSRWIVTATNGNGLPQTSVVPPGAADRPADPRVTYGYDPVRSRSLLAKAGFGPKKELPILRLELRGTDALSRALGEAFKDQFEKVGIQIQPVFNTFADFIDKIRQGNFQLALAGWTLDYPDAENAYQLLYGPNQSPGLNIANYVNPKLDVLFEELSSRVPGPTRASLLRRLEDIIQEECPWILGIHAPSQELIQPWVSLLPGSTIYNRYKYAAIKSSKKN